MLPLLVIDEVTEPRRVDDSEAKANTVLLDICAVPLLSNHANFPCYQTPLPALMLSIATVCGRSALGGKGSLGGYRPVLKRVLMRVDLPKPDSPETR